MMDKISKTTLHYVNHYSKNSAMHNLCYHHLTTARPLDDLKYTTDKVGMSVVFNRLAPEFFFFNFSTLYIKCE